jgi:hypothetical protein
MAIRFLEDLAQEELAGSPYRELPKDQLDRLKQQGSPMPPGFKEKYLKNLPKKAELDPTSTASVSDTSLL